MSCALVLLMAIDVVIVVWGCPSPPVISKGVGVTRKVPRSVIIVILVGLYLLSFQITRYDLIRV
jgi:hypothetical protein